MRAILTALAVLTAFPAGAQDMDESTLKFRQADQVDLVDPIEPHDVAALTYYNADPANSPGASGRWVSGYGIRVKYSVQVQGPENDQGREIIRVMEIDPPFYIADPVEMRALDGETVTIRITLPAG